MRQVVENHPTNFEGQITRGIPRHEIVYRAEVRPDIIRDACQYLVEHQTFFNSTYDSARELPLRILYDNRLPEDTFAPAQGFRPTSFLQLTKPFSKVMPMFFPEGRGDADGTSLSERDWAIHMLRCVKKDLLESPLFVFAEAFRLDTTKIIKAFHNSASYTKSDGGRVLKREGAGGPTWRGSQEYYEK